MSDCTVTGKRYFVTINLDDLEDDQIKQRLIGAFGDDRVSSFRAEEVDLENE